MTITPLDRRTALIIVDLQNQVMGVDTKPFSTAEVLQHCIQLADAFRARQMPVILVRTNGAPRGRNEWTRAPASAPDQSDEAGILRPELTNGPHHVVAKQTWGAFVGTDLHERLQALGVTEIAVAGIATSIGIESTARSAYEYGYNVVLVTDAMADRDVTAHENSTTRIFPRLGETGTTAQLIALLSRPDAARPNHCTG